jgi:acyl-CoA thioester hydrolase
VFGFLPSARRVSASNLPIADQSNLSSFIDLSVDPIVYSVRWNVRPYELDGNGHVNNAVYLNYAEAITIEHAEAAGYGAAWTAAHGGAWMVHRTVVTYHLPAVYGDVLDLTVRVELVQGVRGIRRTTIRRHPDGAAVAEVLTEWVWVGQDGRPARVPQELVELARDATLATLRRNPRFVRDIGRRV